METRLILKALLQFCVAFSHEILDILYGSTVFYPFTGIREIQLSLLSQGSVSPSKRDNGQFLRKTV
ncbi:hypothetical protein ALC60_06521 [Trachymyrmex zeteki]|uniref:Uncharacterized protein n=1 Tax=Mycetomoellerius zeteki TaxID=64791 RepID=A0A151X2E8_9HYME|nr:hypothetical protein ALC60_06521 [Trachymyrmex zeteki]